MVAPLAQERNVQVTVDTDGQAIVLQADRTRISQLLTNLLGNAIRYNREGGSVTLTAARNADHAILQVADAGVAIAPDEQRHVFERFFRADKARSREAGGSGLGLAICQSIVEAHHGQIHFTSRPGEGMTFTVELPLNGIATSSATRRPASIETTEIAEDTESTEQML
ncbi:MAG TPA: ATP-binding protein [Tepidisphaeraceae bacterium]|nr:ATP-binding protein [Tepidisphaeraceae bacterium]